MHKYLITFSIIRTRCSISFGQFESASKVMKFPLTVEKGTVHISGDELYLFERLHDHNSSSFYTNAFEAILLKLPYTAGIMQYLYCKTIWRWEKLTGGSLFLTGIDDILKIK